MPKKRGRKEKYKKAWNEEVVELGKQGYIDSQIADHFGISLATLYNYKNRYPDFNEALENSKKQADFKVKESLFKRALGYDVEEMEIIDGEMGTTTKRKRKHIPADVKAMLVWLQNREEGWREKQDIKTEGDFVIDVSLGDDDE